MDDHPSDFLEETIQFWSPRAGRRLTREDARETVHNVVGFFKILHEWSLKEQQSGPDQHTHEEIQREPTQETVKSQRS